MAATLQNSERTVTLKSSEGSVYTEPLPSWSFFTENQYRIILIHGYNNSETDAFESYERFRKVCSKYSAYHADRVFYLIWSGDQFNNLVKWFDDNTKNALESGRNLGIFLERIISGPRDQNCQFVIVAHSLGCRLTAELIGELYKRNRSFCGQFKLFLMAGAVRSDDILGGNRFGEAFAAAGSVVNLHSPDDSVLSGAFRWGEWGGGRSYSEAIGLNAEPREFKSWQPKLMEGFRHDYYWKEESVVEFILQALGVAVPMALPINEIASYKPPEHFLT